MDQLLHVPSIWVYLIVGTLVFAEAAVFVGFVLPGETAVLLGGVTASLGHVSVAVLLGLVVATAIAGDSVGYEVGRRFGPRILGSRWLRPHQSRLANAQDFLRDRGGWAVLLGRFTAFLRAVMPALAGASEMPYRRFLLFNAAGGTIWGVGVVLVGYVAGQSYRTAERALGTSSAVFLVILALLGFAVWHRRRHSAAHPRTS
ncbi:MAG: DedA family protein [Ornithinimicrobium sp.]